VYDAAGNKLATMTGQTLTKGIVPLPGGIQATYDPTNSGYRIPDWLGSVRFSSTNNRTYAFSHAFAPFGERYSNGGNPPYNFTFTGDTNSTVSDEYDFPARSLQTSQGRWISPDPAGLGAVDLANPQSWNRYAYVMGDPTGYVDPGGTDACSRWGAGCQFVAFNGMSGMPNINEFDFLQLAFTPTKAYLIPDPEVPYSDNSKLLVEFGAIDILGLLNPIAPPSTTSVQAANNEPSWWGAFAKNLFSWKNFTTEFKQGGCVNVAVNATASALNPFSPSLATAGEGTAAVLAATKYNAAVQYAVSAPNYLGGTGLIYPMKSSVVRGMIADANATAAEAPLFAVDGALLQGVIAEGISMAKGECH